MAAKIPSARRQRWALWHIGGAVAALTAALALAFVSGRSADPGFTELWAETLEGSVEVGVRNLEGAPMTYRLDVVGDTEILHRWPAVVLSPGDSWEQGIEMPAQTPQRIEVVLLRGDQPEQPYRRVVLWPSRATQPTPCRLQG